MNKLFFLSVLSMSSLITACTEEAKPYDATGTFEATELTISAKVSGELRHFSLSEGQTLSEQQRVGDIDVYQFQQKQSELDAATAQLSATATATESRQLDLQKQVAALAEQIANVRHEEARFAQLVADGAVPRKQLDDIRQQLRVLQGQMTATQDQIRSNNASLSAQAQAVKAQSRGVEAQKRQVADQIQNATIIAPMAGTVLEKYVEQGEFVSVGKPLFKMADIKHMSLRAYVTSAQLKNLKVGQKATVMADYGRGEKKHYEGTVVWIANRAEFTPKTIVTDDERADLVYAIKVSFANDGYAKIGMYGEVKFTP